MTHKTKLLYEYIGHNVKKIRKSKKIGQLQLSNQTSLSRPSISNIESGKSNFSIAVLFEIASALNVTINDILPSLETYKSINKIDMRYFEAFNDFADVLSKKNLSILKSFLKEDE